MLRLLTWSIGIAARKLFVLNFYYIYPYNLNSDPYNFH